MDISSLHPLEKRLLPVLQKTQEYDTLLKQSEMKEVEVLRALQWLSNKEIISLQEEAEDVVLLDTNGKAYAQDGLPERRFLKTLAELDRKNISSSEVAEHSGLDKNEITICIGTLKRKVAIDIAKEGNELQFSITDQGKKLLDKESLEEQFLASTFPKKFPLYMMKKSLLLMNLRKENRFSKLKNKKHEQLQLHHKERSF
jgi:phenylalanyl-tRNA synthetase alpha chain